MHCSSNSDINCTLKIETAEVKKIIDSASKLNTEVLNISGGEPFLHDGLLEIVHYAKSKGIKVYIYTKPDSIYNKSLPCDAVHTNSSPKSAVVLSPQWTYLLLM